MEIHSFPCNTSSNNSANTSPIASTKSKLCFWLSEMTSYLNLNVGFFNQVKTITLTTLAFPVEAVGAIENSDEDIIELFLSVNVSENHRSG